jgi:hypothetical protein
LQERHPLKKLFDCRRIFQRYTSPLQKMAQEHQTYDIETIVAYPIAPWEKRIDVIIERDRQKATKSIRNIEGVIIASCALARKGLVGIGISIDTALRLPANVDPITDYKETIGSQDSFNIYFAELIAIAAALHSIIGLF